MKAAQTLGANCPFNIFVGRRGEGRSRLQLPDRWRCVRRPPFICLRGDHRRRGLSCWWRLGCRQVESLNFRKAHPHLRVYPSANPSCPGMPYGYHSLSWRLVGPRGPGPTGGLEVWLIGQGAGDFLTSARSFPLKAPLAPASGTWAAGLSPRLTTVDTFPSFKERHVDSLPTLGTDHFIEC